MDISNSSTPVDLVVMRIWAPYVVGSHQQNNDVQGDDTFNIEYLLNLLDGSDGCTPTATMVKSISSQYVQNHSGSSYQQHNSMNSIIEAKYIDAEGNLKHVY